MGATSHFPSAGTPEYLGEFGVSSTPGEARVFKIRQQAPFALLVETLRKSPGKAQVSPDPD